MKMTDQELQDCVKVLDNMLSDSTTLAAHPDAMSAKRTLDKVIQMFVYSRKSLDVLEAIVCTVRSLYSGDITYKEPFPNS